jgi:NAD(P)H dehydrogenase (quinone)
LIAASAHFKTDQAAPVATVAELEQYDAIIVGAPTRYGRMPSQMAAFLDQTGSLWARGALNGEVGAAFISTATQHGGQEQTLFSVITNLLHFGMVIVGLPYSHAGQMSLDEIVGGSPYGASTIAGGQGPRQPSEIDLAGARHQASWWRAPPISCSADSACRPCVRRPLTQQGRAASRHARPCRYVELKLPGGSQGGWYGHRG